jgi:hypothetical protein
VGGVTTTFVRDCEFREMEQILRYRGGLLSGQGIWLRASFRKESVISLKPNVM